MRVLLDTDIIIECLKGNNEIIGRLEELHDKGSIISCTPISIAEIYSGLRKGEEKKTEELFQTMELLSINGKIGQMAGMYLAKFRKSHSLEIADALIAAAACINNYYLYTLNQKHYPMKDVKRFG
ncbi:MAG: PIN domain-containing protein [bacterium]